MMRLCPIQQFEFKLYVCDSAYFLTHICASNTAIGFLFSAAYSLIYTPMCVYYYTCIWRTYSTE